jgi:hypoxia up-regulated 1
LTTSANHVLAQDSVSSLILVGGSTRIPAVQTALRDLVGEEKIAKNVNSDEAAVMGAGFRGAGISRQFKVRDIRVKDINVFPVEIGYAAEAKEGKEERTINTLLFAENAVLPSRKLMTFRRNTDFTFGVAYRAMEGKEVPLPARFLEAEVPGVADAIASFKGNESVKIVGEPKVKATIALSESGLVNVVDAGVYFDIEVSKSLKGGLDGRGIHLNKRLSHFHQTHRPRHVLLWRQIRQLHGNKQHRRSSRARRNRPRAPLRSQRQQRHRARPEN